MELKDARSSLAYTLMKGKTGGHKNNNQALQGNTSGDITGDPESFGLPQRPAFWAEGIGEKGHAEILQQFLVV